ncbi:MAG: PqqD family protein [Candidatus Schekmanbacteria bacterium]|nr:PqqD family protein [Candidatus Schekmanbacteria bacterium]
MLTANSVVSQCRRMLSTELGGELVMMDVEAGAYYVANGLGGVIWRLIDRPMSVDAVVDAVVERYEVEWGRCREDVLAFLTRLYQAELIDLERPQDPPVE